MIDWKRVAELQEEVGEEDFAEVAGLFLEEVAEGLAEFDPGAGIKAVQAHLHNLKGSALNLGFSEFAALCATFEAPDRVTDFGAPEHAQLRQCFETSKAGFEAKFGSDLP